MYSPFIFGQDGPININNPTAGFAYSDVDGNISFTPKLLLINDPSAIYSGNYTFYGMSGVADGAGVTAFQLNTLNTLSNATAKLLSIKNNGTEKVKILASGIYNPVFDGDQFAGSQDPSIYREGSWSTTASGGIYTLAGELIMKYQSHNAALNSSTGNFLGRDETDACQLYLWTESGNIAYYYAPTGAIGSTPAYDLRFRLNLSDGSFLNGSGNTVSGAGAFANGSNNSSIGLYATTIGSFCQADGYSFAFGNTSIATQGSLAGMGATSNGYGSLAIGADNINDTTAFYGVIIGGFSSYNFGYISSIYGGVQNNIDSSTTFSTIVGSNNSLIGAYGASAIGNGNIVSGTGVAIGSNCTSGDPTISTSGICIGSNAKAYGGNSLCIGQFSTAWADICTVIGNGVRNTIASSLSFGIGDVTQTAPVMFLSSNLSFVDSSRFAIARSTSVGTEIITNGGFPTDLSSWAAGTDWVWDASGRAKKNPGISSGTLSQSISGLIIGAVYCLSYDFAQSGITNESQYMTPSLTGGMSKTFGNRNSNTITSHREEFIATATTATLVFTVTGTTCTVYLDNISLKQITGGDLSVAGTLYSNKSLVMMPGTTTIAQAIMRSGSLLTSAQVGAFEFVTDNLFFTGTTGTTRKTISDFSYRAITAARTLDGSDELVDCTSGTFAVTLPTAVGFTKQYIVKNSGTGVITINTTSGQTIDGYASGFFDLNKNDSMTFRSNGSNWIQV